MLACRRTFQYGSCNWRTIMKWERGEKNPFHFLVCKIPKNILDWLIVCCMMDLREVLISYSFPTTDRLYLSVKGKHMVARMDILLKITILLQTRFDAVWHNSNLLLRPSLSQIFCLNDDHRSRDSCFRIESSEAPAISRDNNIQRTL